MPGEPVQKSQHGKGDDPQEQQAGQKPGDAVVAEIALREPGLDQQQVPDELAGKPVRIRQRRQVGLAGIQEGVHDGEKIQRINLFQLLPHVISEVPDAQVNVLSPGGIACHKATEHEEKADRRGGAIGGGVPEKDPALRVTDIYV